MTADFTGLVQVQYKVWKHIVTKPEQTKQCIQIWKHIVTKYETIIEWTYNRDLNKYLKKTH